MAVRPPSRAVWHLSASCSPVPSAPRRTRAPRRFCRCWMAASGGSLNTRSPALKAWWGHRSTTVTHSMVGSGRGKCSAPAGLQVLASSGHGDASAINGEGACPARPTPRLQPPLLTFVANTPLPFPSPASCRTSMPRPAVSCRGVKGRKIGDSRRRQQRQRRRSAVCVRSFGGALIIGVIHTTQPQRDSWRRRSGSRSHLLMPLLLRLGRLQGQQLLHCSLEIHRESRQVTRCPLGTALGRRRSGGACRACCPLSDLAVPLRSMRCTVTGSLRREQRLNWKAQWHSVGRRRKLVGRAAQCRTDAGGGAQECEAYVA